ncbi:MAG: hypothetical protein KME13_18010 [Myxacorys californica WJT36-NPBG1]|jgi:hypothetical protein|nr:hypothetical protein [Myxacorys californica WJT36-NPBG1]
MSAADLMARIDAARGEQQRASDLLAEARGMFEPKPEPPPPEPPQEGLFDIAHTVLDVAGFIPGVGVAADLLNAGLYAAEGNYAMAGLSAVAAVPVVGDAAAAAKLGAKGIDAAAGAARATDTAAEVARVTPSSGGPVVFTAPPGSTPEQIEQVRQYVDGCNDALAAGALSPTGRVSTKGDLAREATNAARRERNRATAAGQSYQGSVGHVPDTTWVGRPEPHSWMDIDPKVNSSLAGQSANKSKYPEGYQPTGFEYGGVADG